MTIQVALTHRTRYRYDRPVELGPQIIRLRPAPHCRNRILGYALNIKPALHFLNWQQDPQGNHLARLLFPEKTKEFSIDVDLVVEMAVFNPFDFFLEPDAEHTPFAYAPWLRRELAPYLETLPPGSSRRISPRSRAGGRAPSTSSWTSTQSWGGASATSSAWSRGSRPATRR